MHENDCQSQWWAFSSASRRLFKMPLLENPGCVLITKRHVAFFFFFPVYKSAQTSRWQDHGSVSDFTFLSGVLISFFSGICLSSSSRLVIKSTMSLPMLESARTFSCWGMIPTDRLCSHFLMPHRVLTTVRTSLMAPSPDPVVSSLTINLNTNHAINAVMFYIHLSKGHKETRHFRTLTPPPPCLPLLVLPHSIIGFFREQINAIDWTGVQHQADLNKVIAGGAAC